MTVGQYILPAEAAAILAFVLFPALMCAVGAQVFHLYRRGIFTSNPTRAAIGLLGTVLLSVGFAVGTLLMGPAAWGPLLGVRELPVFGQQWLVWPFGFVTSAAAAWFTTRWLVRSVESAA
jgi:hypothetical protein